METVNVSELLVSRGWRWLPLLMGMGATFLAVPIVRRIASAYDLYDRPDAGLKPHEKPVPYLGGVAIWFGWLVHLLVSMARSWSFHAGQSVTDPIQVSRAVPGPVLWQLTWIAVGGSILMLVGLVDDIRHLPPKVRLVLQAAVAGLLLYAGIGRGVWQALV